MSNNTSDYCSGKNGSGEPLSSTQPHAGLIPSQAVNRNTDATKKLTGGSGRATSGPAGTTTTSDDKKSSSHEQQRQHNTNNNNRTRCNSRNDGRRRRPAKPMSQQNEGNDQATVPPPFSPKNANNNSNSDRQRGGNRGRNQRQPPPARNSGTDKAPMVAAAAGNADQASENLLVANNSSSNKRSDKNNSRRNRQKQNRRKHQQQQQERRYPWRKHIPEESVDPITLDSLHSLPYPPFALFAEQPYDPIEVWPFPENDTAGEEGRGREKQQDEETEEQRQQRILREQWGNQLKIGETKDSESEVPTNDTSNNKSASLPAPPVKDRHVHLYDGRALAYYMVSQLQFIDPLNRRDLVRDEIVNLDRYLRRHGFRNLNVTEAYDAKGITISRAGAAGNTAAGRAAILQQEAAVLLNALFGGPSPLPDRSSTGSASQSANNNNNNHLLLESYQAREQSQVRQHRMRPEHRTVNSQQQQQRQGQNQSYHQQDDSGIYGDAGGILVIDDDLNPGLRGDATMLRGDAAEFVPSSAGGSVSSPYTLWSSSHIAAQFGHQAQRRAADFPALSPPPATATSATSNNHNKKPLPKSKTLSKIAVSVKKTDPEERQRMYMAHEAWRRRTMMSNLTFGVDPIAPESLQTAPVSQSGSSYMPAEPTEAQLDRNRALAEALNVKPATMRKAESGSSLKSGWARPATSDVGGLDEFGMELTAPNYPDELILEARERLALLVKLERRWKLFLEDDKAASLPLWPMDRPARTFVHQYSDFWGLKTESFDPEPKRYIHCVKLLDTRAPSVLLSDAARNWKGPQEQQQRKELLNLQELPRSSKGIYSSSNEPHSRQTAGETTNQESTTRWDALGKLSRESSPQRERPKLDLQKRTLPLELPPYQPPASSSLGADYFNSDERKLRQERMEEKARKEREQVEAKKRALEAAFASDEEDDEDGDRRGDDDDSEWTEEEEQYVSEGDEDN
ncbi:hypothetical protein ACA910_019887 [Epithemia clementina (nom. ined.)]